MRRTAFATALFWVVVARAAAGAGHPAALPVAMEGGILAPVDQVLGKLIADAQDGKEVAFTITLDGGKAEPLAIAPERLRDYQNVYYRVAGGPGAWCLEEAAFSPTGADDESRRIRQALGVPPDKKVFFLPGREHLVLPARRRAVLKAAGKTWTFQVTPPSIAPGPRPATQAVLVRAGQRVSLRLAQGLSSASARAGDTVRLAVATPVTADGLVAVGQGAEVEARVARVTRPGVPGNPGVVVLELGPVAAVDGTEIALLAADGTARVILSARPSCLLSSGKHLSLPEGTEVVARVAQTRAVLAPK